MELKPTERQERILTWHKDRPIYAHRWRKSDGERAISIVVHNPQGDGIQSIEFSSKNYGDDYEMAARHALELLGAAVDFPVAFSRMARQERKMNVAINKSYAGDGLRKRVFLDELPPDAGRYDAEPDIECGVLCVTGQSGYAEDIPEEAVEAQ